MKRLLIFVVCILCIFFCVIVFFKKLARIKEDTIPVRVMRITLQDIEKSLDYVDDIRAEEEVVIYPRASGKIVEKLKEDGSLVNKGDIIAYIDRDEVGFEFEKLPVESFLAGVVGRVYVDIGTNVTPETPVALVVKMDNVEINLDIPEKYLPSVFVGEAASLTVDAYPGETFSGIVKKVSPVVDLDTRTAPIEIAISNKDYRLKSGMFARVKLVIEEHKGVPVILKEAIIGREPDTYVYVVENQRAYLRKIKLGIRQGPYFEVKEGLKEGDLVVIMGQQRLRDNSLVSVEMADETYNMK